MCNLIDRLQLYPDEKEGRTTMGELAEKMSASELEVVEMLWQAGEPMPVARIREALAASHGWDGSTVKTLLRRLCDKGVVQAQKREVFYYSPLLSRKQYQSWSVRSLLQKVYRGSARDLVASLVSEAQLSQSDIEELRAILYPEEDGHA